jgi:aromatic ring-opening dioxygenase catalytic subunit (LigB family)
MFARGMPTLLISKRSPMPAVAESAARRFLAAPGLELPRPSAVVIARPTLVH